MALKVVNFYEKLLINFVFCTTEINYLLDSVSDTIDLCDLRILKEYYFLMGQPRLLFCLFSSFLQI